MNVKVHKCEFKADGVTVTVDRMTTTKNAVYNGRMFANSKHECGLWTCNFCHSSVAERNFLKQVPKFKITGTGA